MPVGDEEVIQEDDEINLDSEDDVKIDDNDSSELELLDDDSSELDFDDQISQAPELDLAEAADEHLPQAQLELEDEPALELIDDSSATDESSLSLPSSAPAPEHMLEVSDVFARADREHVDAGIAETVDHHTDLTTFFPPSYSQPQADAIEQATEHGWLQLNWGEDNIVLWPGCELILGKRRQPPVHYPLRLHEASDQRRTSGAISRQHCQLIINGDGAQLCDLGSANGTILNEQDQRRISLKRSQNQHHIG